MEYLNSRLLGNFFDLTSAFLGSNILSIAHKELEKFIDELKQCFRKEREPLFNAELGFSKEGKSFKIFFLKDYYLKYLLIILDKLTMVPSKPAFVSQIMNAVRKICESIENASRIIDFRGSLKDFEKYGFNLLR